MTRSLKVGRAAAYESQVFGLQTLAARDASYLVRRIATTFVAGASPFTISITRALQALNAAATASR